MKAYRLMEWKHDGELTEVPEPQPGSGQVVVKIGGAGAHHAVLADEDAAATIAELTGGRGAEFVIDVVGADETPALAAAVTRPLGNLTIVGIAGGVLPVSFFGIAYEAAVATTYWGTLPELHEVIALAQSGAVHSKVERYALDDVGRAYDAMVDGSLTGRAVIVP